MDIAIIGAGAAGLMTAIAAGRRNRQSHHGERRILLLDGARTLGAKILVAGGGRCNVTNARVTEEDFWGGSRNVIRRVLHAFPAEQTRRFFAELGVPLHEEEYGKLFPDSNRARSVLDALIDEARRCGVRIQTGWRVVRIERAGAEFALHGAEASAPSVLRAARVVLATGGLSLPKTGSDGAGYGFAQALGHTLVPCTPGLAPLRLDGDFHIGLAGVSQGCRAHAAFRRKLRIRQSWPPRQAGPRGRSAAVDALRH